MGSVELGSMAPIQVVQAQSQVAAAEQALLNAQVQWRSAELGLKSLLIGGADDPLLLQTINPTGVPTLQEQAVDIDAALQVALRERADLRQQRQQLAISELELDVSQDGRLPTLDLVASYSLQGVGGTLLRLDVDDSPGATFAGLRAGSCQTESAEDDEASDGGDRHGGSFRVSLVQRRRGARTSRDRYSCC